MTLPSIVLWAALTVILVLVEIATVQLVAVWFAAGSLVAFIAALCGADFNVQLMTFIAVSIVLLAATRPLAHRLMRGKKTPTNADRVLGKECVVREEINNMAGTGRAFVDGMLWTARSVDADHVIPVGQKCIVKEIQGVKLMVVPKES